MNASLLLDRILAPGGLRVVFQPILERRDGRWRLHAFESLVRGPADTNLRHAEVLFGYARRKQAEVCVDRVCVEAILQAAVQLGTATRLTINVHGVTIERDRAFARFLTDQAVACGFPLNDLTIEIVEHSATDGGPAFGAGLGALRELGCAIAIDDIGLGQSNYRMLLAVRPDYFKLDRFLVHGCSTDAYRRDILRSISDLARSVGAFSVGEGVDNVEDLSAVLDAGIPLVQGFLLAEPATAESLGTNAAVSAAAAALPARPALDWENRTDWLMSCARSRARRPLRGVA